jgi:LPXTG-motif cell wall-anchored protein
MKTVMNEKRTSKKITLSAVVLIAGVMAFGQGGMSAASAADDAITSVSAANCSVTAGYSVTLTGTFPTPISNVWANEIQIPIGSWAQTQTTVVLAIPASSVKTFTIRTYNGGEVLSKDFTCTEAVVVVPPVVDPVDTTEDGGLLPDTATNNYNYLVIGIGLMFAASVALLRRRTIRV